MLTRDRAGERMEFPGEGSQRVTRCRQRCVRSEILPLTFSRRLPHPGRPACHSLTPFSCWLAGVLPARPARANPQPARAVLTSEHEHGRGGLRPLPLHCSLLPTVRIRTTRTRRFGTSGCLGVTKHRGSLMSPLQPRVVSATRRFLSVFRARNRSNRKTKLLFLTSNTTHAHSTRLEVYPSI
jgi:hypothetical protein